MTTTCPICGGQLVATAASPDTAPWLCAPCHRAWWEAELTTEALKAWRHAARDFGYRPAVRIATTIERERALVRSKGTQ